MMFEGEGEAVGAKFEVLNIVDCVNVLEVILSETLRL